MVHYYIYLNPNKIDSLFSQLRGIVEIERKERTEKGLKGTGKLGMEIGSILAKLGIGKATGEAELNTNYTKILEVSSTLSNENKANLLHEYYIREQRAEIISIDDVQEEKLLETIDSNPVQIFSGGFSYNEFEGKETDELWSEVRQKGSEFPLIKVPIFRDNLLRDQALNAWTEEDYFSTSILCQCIVTKKGIIGSPIAVWWSNAVQE